MSVLLVLALVIPAQEDVDALIRKLGDDSVAVREEASTSLLKLGEKARLKLEGAAASGDAGIKARAAAVLAILDREKRDRALLPPPTRVTLAGEMTLREAMDAVERQGGRKVDCALWPEGKFRIDLKDVEYWKALEAIAKASGARTLTCEPTGPRLAGEKHVPQPSVVKGTFRLHVSKITDRIGMYFDKGAEDQSFSIHLSLGWESQHAPARLYVRVDSVQDDLGTDFTTSVAANLRFTGHDVIFATAEKPLRASTLDLRSGEGLKPQAKRFSRIAGSITAFLRASEENLRVPMPKLTDEWAPVLEVIEMGSDKPVVGESTVWVVKREQGFLKCNLKFRNFDSRLLCTFGDLWTVKGPNQAQAKGWADASSDQNRMAPELWLSFKDAEAVTEVQALEIPIPKRMIKVEIPFEFKDVDLR
jgi:hypothetical protein